MHSRFDEVEATAGEIGDQFTAYSKNWRLLTTAIPPTQPLPSTLAATMAPKVAKKTSKKSTVKFVIDCAAPVDDKVLDIASFEKYLNERIKVEGKTGNLTQTNVLISRDRTKITVASPSDLGLSKRQLKYLSKRYLKKQQLRDYLRVIASSKNSYELKYYSIAAGNDDEDAAE